MTGELSVGGVFVPTLLLLFFAAMLATGLVVRLLGPSGFYRFFAYRALVDLCLFVLMLGGVVLLAINFGFQP